MKILLLGEYSNVHATLAEGLRALGHDVLVVSDGDGWKNYPRDISLKRTSTSIPATLNYLLHVFRLLPKLKDFDVVQLINPVFLSLKADKIPYFYHKIRKQNKSLFMGAFGMDYYWVKAGLDCTTFRYSDFNMGSEIRHSKENDIWIHDWLLGSKGKLNRAIAEDCDGIISGLYEYDVSYRPYFQNKLKFIPFPINPNKTIPIQSHHIDKVRFFIGVQKARSEYKGTDIMLRALRRVEKELPDRCTVVRVESVPFAEYQQLMNSCDVMLDQLYSYTPAMNALLAMAKGLVVVGGGEPENYEILQENTLHPIINVLPNEESVYIALRNLALHPEMIPEFSQQSVDYIQKHHHYMKVAQQYLDFWQSRFQSYS
ncbi:MAG: glycosyltransferase family 1 protein [Bacteroidaceae bacterium]|jgi:glycosyltransferase involved in cell wall biosynthesis|nr:glycosyltransferase family 1 protein [Bacteroidaceae bacterium]